jgi:hypothetical protein
MLKRLLRFLQLPVVTTTSLQGALVNVPPGMVPDTAALFGMSALQVNIDAIDYDMVAIAYGAATTLTLTGAQFFNNYIDLSGSGVLALTTPTAAQIIAACPSTMPSLGFNFSLTIINDGTGQTTTLTGGTGVTVLGNNTIANNATRVFLVAVNPVAATVTMLNVGSVSL